MNEILGTIASCLLICFFLFYVPIYLLSYNQELIDRSRIEVLTEDFVDKVRISGYITREQLNLLESSISDGGTLCYVEVTAYESYLYLDENGTYKKEFCIITHEEIRSRLQEGIDFPDSIFEFHRGDYLNVKVTNIVPQFTTKLTSMLGGSSIKISEIAISEGGMIRNDNGFWRDDI